MSGAEERGTWCLTPPWGQRRRHWRQQGRRRRRGGGRHGRRWYPALPIACAGGASGPRGLVGAELACWDGSAAVGAGSSRAATSRATTRPLATLMLPGSRLQRCWTSAGAGRCGKLEGTAHCGRAVLEAALDQLTRWDARTHARALSPAASTARGGKRPQCLGRPGSRCRRFISDCSVVVARLVPPSAQRRPKRSRLPSSGRCTPQPPASR